MSFLNELKRRNVFKVAVAYAIVAWLLLQLMAILLPTFDAPDWIMKVFVTILGLGFVVALFVAWAFELTPEGIKSSSNSSEEEGVRPASSNKLNTIMISGLAMVLVLVVVDAYVLKGDSDSATSLAESSTSSVTTLPTESGSEEVIISVDKTIAVLPFLNLSSDPEQEYFSDGLSEEILNQLVQVNELRVTARTSSFSFKGKNDDLRVIGEKLGVNFILEGSVRKAGNDLRITAQLINTNDGTHLWSKTYERELNDVFKIQEEIATEVAKALAITLDAGEMSLANGGTNNVDAYDKYLQGRAIARRTGSSQDILQATQLFREALAEDPLFVKALHSLYSTFEDWLIYLPDRAEEARLELERIRVSLLDIAPSSPQALSIQASTLMYEFRWAEAETAYNAIDDGNQNTRASASLSINTIFTINRGYIKEGVPLVEYNRLTDPLSLNASYAWQIMLSLANRNDEAQEEYERSQTLEGDHFLVDQYAFMRNYTSPEIDPDDAKAQLIMLIENYPTQNHELFSLMLDQFEDREQSLLTLYAALENPDYQQASTMIFLAVFANYFNDKALTLAALHRSYIDLKGTNIAMLFSPLGKNVRTEPEFKTIIRDLGLYDYWRDTGHWGDFCRPLPETENDFVCD